MFITKALHHCEEACLGEDNTSDGSSFVSMASGTGSNSGDVNPTTAARVKKERFEFFRGLKKKFPGFKPKIGDKPAPQSGAHDENHGVLGTPNTTSSSMSIKTFMHQPQPLARKIAHQWLWPFRESQFVELLQSLKDTSDILQKFLQLEHLCVKAVVTSLYRLIRISANIVLYYMSTEIFQ